MKMSITSLFLLAIFPIATICSAEEGLAFYLVKENKNKEANVAGLDSLQIDKVPLFTEREIISYSISNQSMALTESALIKLKEVGVGSSFVVCVNGSRIYSGKIWSPLRSASCPEIVLMVSPSNNGQVSLLAGYPTHSYFTGTDQRSSKSILDALKASGKLKS